MDSIQLTGIRCYGYTGYLPEEQVLGQWFEVDVTLWVDLSQAGKSDDIQHTLDYRSAITLIQQLVKDSKFLLIERLADAIAQSLLQLPLVEKVQVQLSKPAAPIPDFGGRITLEITRTKDETAVETASTPTMSASADWRWDGGWNRVYTNDVRLRGVKKIT